MKQTNTTHCAAVYVITLQFPLSTCVEISGVGLKGSTPKGKTNLGLLAYARNFGTSFLFSMLEKGLFILTSSRWLKAL